MMALLKNHLFVLATFLFVILSQHLSSANVSPVVVVTWDYPNATQKAWETIYSEKRSALDAIEEGCTLCERMQCRGTVGYGGQPDENGETTLDALIMDGVTMDIGAVGGIRHVKDAISVARKVMEKTRHSLLGGELAADFAVQMGFKEESLQTEKSLDMWKKWKDNSCQPNFWEEVTPNPRTTCGPYSPGSTSTNPSKRSTIPSNSNDLYGSSGVEDNHDTIGVIALDTQARLAAGVSTNGQNHKIPGRIGDSAVSGAGAYADNEVGAAAATGDGDIIMRFLPSFLSVELMRLGVSPMAATETAVRRMIKHYPNFRGAVIALNKAGEFGAACHGLTGRFNNSFPYYVARSQPPSSSPDAAPVQALFKPCIEIGN